MKITFLKDLKKNPKDLDSNSRINRSIPETEITQLEALYNNGNPFPKALKELLYLAGDYCYLLDYGLADNQQELQEFVLENLGEYNKVISRPFYVIDVYNSSDQFLFVYLDEGDDPIVYEAHYFYDSDPWITHVSDNLSEYIIYMVRRVKEGGSPF